jgi:hypothetical protein
MQALRPGLIKASVKLPTRNPAKKAWLVARVPHGSIQRVMLNGKPWTKMDSKLEAIELPAGGADLRLEIYYR